MDALHDAEGRVGPLEVGVVVRGVEPADVQDGAARRRHCQREQSGQGGIAVGDQRRAGVLAQDMRDVGHALAGRRAVVGLEVLDLRIIREVPVRRAVHPDLAGQEKGRSTCHLRLRRRGR